MNRASVACQVISRSLTLGVPEKEKRDNGAEQTLEEIRLTISQMWWKPTINWPRKFGQLHAGNMEEPTNHFTFGLLVDLKTSKFRMISWYFFDTSHSSNMFAHFPIFLIWVNSITLTLLLKMRFWESSILVSQGCSNKLPQTWWL